jgi:hypothetical protein
MKHSSDNPAASCLKRKAAASPGQAAAIRKKIAARTASRAAFSFTRRLQTPRSRRTAGFEGLNRGTTRIVEPASTDAQLIILKDAWPRVQCDRLCD